MLTPSLSFLRAQTPSSSTSGMASPSDPSFEATLAGANRAQSVSETFGAQKPDPVDEEKALRELFHILAMLSLGQVDSACFTASEGSSGAPPGPKRMDVERLKEVIRKLMQGGGEDLELDPATGKPKVRRSGSSASGETSLRALFRALPTEIQNLLRRAFPDLDQRLLDEQQMQDGRKAESGAPSVDPTDARPAITGTAGFLARLLDASNRVRRTQLLERLDQRRTDPQGEGF